MSLSNQKLKLSKQEEEQWSSAMAQLATSMIESIDRMRQRLESGHLLLSDDDPLRVDQSKPRKPKVTRGRRLK